MQTCITAGADSGVGSGERDTLISIPNPEGCCLHLIGLFLWSAGAAERFSAGVKRLQLRLIGFPNNFAAHDGHGLEEAGQ